MPIEPFHPFGMQHFITLGVGGTVAGGLLMAARKGGRPRQLAAALLALANLTAWPANYLAWTSLGTPLALDNVLPFHLCDVAAFVAGFALLTRNRQLCGMTYFWGLAATMQALVTPAISVGFPAWAFVTFFVQHFAIVTAALFLPLAGWWKPKRPWWRSPVEAYLWAALYLFVALGINSVLGTNFAFASRVPDNPSLIDHLGPWPWYLLSFHALSVTLFLLLALPWKKNSGTRS
ncbi:MAG: TIGR02206 family membrane protein [Verrucomicrobiae bacterium]|nr:TIGR02206 family membrane protein [Verrucomicrobiae bacterium]